MMLSMSQEKLGEHLGITFQQIQKYEKGTNRIGASRLQHIATVLEVPVSFFFEDAPGTPQEAQGLAESKSENYVIDFLSSSDRPSIEPCLCTDQRPESTSQDRRTGSRNLWRWLRKLIAKSLKLIRQLGLILSRAVGFVFLTALFYWHFPCWRSKNTLGPKYGDKRHSYQFGPRHSVFFNRDCNIFPIGRFALDCVKFPDVITTCRNLYITEKDIPHGP